MNEYKNFVYSLLGILIGACLSIVGQYFLFVYQAQYQDSYNTVNKRIELIDNITKIQDESYKIQNLTRVYTPSDVFLQRTPESINSQIITYNSSVNSILMLSKFYYGESVNNIIVAIESNATISGIVDPTSLYALKKIMLNTFKDKLFTKSFDGMFIIFVILCISIICIAVFIYMLLIGRREKNNEIINYYKDLIRKNYVHKSTIEDLMKSTSVNNYEYND